MASSKKFLFISKVSKYVLLISYVVLISSCGFSGLARRDTNPVIYDYATPPVFQKRSVNVFATTASRRLAIVVHDKNDKDVKSCAEPSPDVGEAFAEAIAAGLKASATITPTAGGSGTGEIAAEFGRNVATQIAPLLYRTQGLQLFRDAIYKLCIDKMNGWIDDDKKYADERQKKYKEAIDLIKDELPLMNKIAGIYFEKISAGNTQIEEPKKASFKITEKSLEHLKVEGVPDDILKKLEEIKDKEVSGEEKFVSLLEEKIGKEPTIQHKSSILNYAQKK